jgi:hypothetical protein
VSLLRKQIASLALNASRFFEVNAFRALGGRLEVTKCCMLNIRGFLWIWKCEVGKLNGIYMVLEKWMLLGRL